MISNIATMMLTAEQDAHIVAFVSALGAPVSKRLVAQGLRGSRAKGVLRKKLPDNPSYGVLTGIPEQSIVLAIERLLGAGRLSSKARRRSPAPTFLRSDLTSILRLVSTTIPIP